MTLPMTAIWYPRETDEIKKLYGAHFGSTCSKSLSCIDICPMQIPTIASMAKMNRFMNGRMKESGSYDQDKAHVFLLGDSGRRNSFMGYIADPLMDPDRTSSRILIG